VDSDKDGLEDKVDDCPNEPEDIDDFNDTDGCPEMDNDEDRILDSADSCPNEKEDRDLFEDDDGCPEKDNDKDGLPDDQDACVNEPGSYDTVGCPDRDGDLLADNRDQCPDQFGPRSDDGCPDRDNDTLSDPRDACPDVAGPVITRGCPDGDADEVEDARDKCPTEPRDPRELPERSDGCPKRVFVSEGKVVILEMVYFDTGKSTIKSVSFGLLDDVARTLNSNADLTVVEVAGHTDNQGKADSNVKLSQARAEAVVRYLVEKGKVDPHRLVAVGYGPNVPIDTNSTTAGRANNRRVEFVIREINGNKVEPTP
jgi:outer membrane protein OmpA-like peptidoglycan-associated protein